MDWLTPPLKEFNGIKKTPTSHNTKLKLNTFIFRSLQWWIQKNQKWGLLESTTSVSKNYLYTFRFIFFIMLFILYFILFFWHENWLSYPFHKIYIFPPHFSYFIRFFFTFTHIFLTLYFIFHNICTSTNYKIVLNYIQQLLTITIILCYE